MLEIHCRPSDLIGGLDDYTAYCFDEACAFIIKRLKDGDEPIVTKKVQQKSYSRPSDFYKDIES